LSLLVPEWCPSFWNCGQSDATAAQKNADAMAVNMIKIIFKELSPRLIYQWMIDYWSG